MTKSEAVAIAGTLSHTSAMPGPSYGTPAEMCITGSKLSKIEGSSCFDCYAKKSFYQVYAHTIKPAQYKRLESIHDDRWTAVMIKLISKTPYFRWHDSGDLQSIAHLEKIVQIALALPDTMFWLPTKEYGMIRQYLKTASFPKNLIVRVSAVMIDSAAPLIGDLPTSQVHTSRAVFATHNQTVYECQKPYNKNTCGDCRACWDVNVKTVSYHKH
jgi:Gene product 88